MFCPGKGRATAIVLDGSLRWKMMPDARMKITDDLERLSKLYREGSLTADEFSKAKAKLLAEESPYIPAPERNYQPITGKAVRWEMLPIGT